MTETYAEHASLAFNAQLQNLLQRLAIDVRAALRDNLVALILGGGYGRGEGGIVCVDGVERPYNDLDLTLVVGRKGAVSMARLAAIGKAYETEIGIEIDFSRPLTLKDIRCWPHCLMWFDLLHGHVVLAGPDDVLQAHAPPALRLPLPPIEATRLLLNRGAGLLWALRIVRGLDSAPDGDFVRRNYYKCALALGDAVLISHRRFTTRYCGRDRRLFTLASEWASVADLDVEKLYAPALRFKFCPDALDGDMPDERQLWALAELWARVFLYVESRRTQQAWFSPEAYAQWQGLREPEAHAGLLRLRNAIHNRRLGRWSVRYPREDLYRSLPLLLAGSECPTESWPEASARFLKVWKRFN